MSCSMVLKEKKKIVIKGLNEEQDLGTILKYCFLYSPFKILPYGFFLMR